MKKLAMLALPLVAVMSSPAMAQDTVGGFRLEALFGFESLVAEYEEGEDRQGENGIFGGAGIGYDFPLGAALSVGADAEFTIGSTDTDATDVGRIKAKRDIYVGGRITSQLSETVAVYGKLGYTNQRIQLVTENDDEDFTLSGNLDGVRAGAGVRFSSDNNTYYGLEYRYSNYEADVERHQGALILGYKF